MLSCFQLNDQLFPVDRTEKENDSSRLQHYLKTDIYVYEKEKRNHLVGYIKILSNSFIVGTSENNKNRDEKKNLDIPWGICIQQGCLHHKMTNITSNVAVHLLLYNATCQTYNPV